MKTNPFTPSDIEFNDNIKKGNNRDLTKNENNNLYKFFHNQYIVGIVLFMITSSLSIIFLLCKNHSSKIEHEKFIKEKKTIVESLDSLYNIW